MNCGHEQVLEIDVSKLDEVDDTTFITLMQVTGRIQQFIDDCADEAAVAKRNRKRHHETMICTGKRDKDVGC